nr:unnamed protein product [Digitaria exilis]
MALVRRAFWARTCRKAWRILQYPTYDSHARGVKRKWLALPWTDSLETSNPLANGHDGQWKRGPVVSDDRHTCDCECESERLLMSMATYARDHVEVANGAAPFRRLVDSADNLSLRSTASPPPPPTTSPSGRPPRYRRQAEATSPLLFTVVEQPRPSSSPRRRLMEGAAYCPCCLLCNGRAWRLAHAEAMLIRLAPGSISLHDDTPAPPSSRLFPF